MYADTSKIKVCFKYFHLDLSGMASDFSEDITSLHIAIYYPWWTPPNKPEPFHWNRSFIFISWIGLPWLISFKPRLSNESTFMKNNFQECFPSECPRHSCPNILWNLDFFFEILPHRFLAFLVQGCLHLHHDVHPWQTLSLSHSKLLLSHTHTQGFWYIRNFLITNILDLSVIRFYIYIIYIYTHTHTHTHTQMTLSVAQ